MSKELTSIKQSFAGLSGQVNAYIASFDPATADMDKVFECYNLIVFLSSAVREWKPAISSVFAECIENQGKQYVIGDKRFYVGKKTTVKCKDPAEVMKRLLEALGGDIDATCGLLSSDPWKQGSVGKMLGEAAHDDLFDKEVKQDLKTGKPLKELKQADDRMQVLSGRGGPRPSVQD